MAIIALVLVVALQSAAGAYHAEFGTDEASHYVSGLFMHDLLLHGLRAPVGYLRDFHAHYPLVGIGHWGPFYYAVEAVWMLILGTGRWSALSLSAAVTVAIALSCYVIAQNRAGRPIALFVAAAFILVPITQEGSAELMLDSPVTLLCLLATASYACWLESRQIRYVVLFALVASAGMLIKGNAACLALLPPFAVLIGRRFDLLRVPSFWLPVPVVGLLVVPWYVVTYGQVSSGFRYAWGFDYIATAVTTNAMLLLATMGPLLLLAAICGWISVVLGRRHGDVDSMMVCLAALAIAVLAFQCVVPAAIQDRYLQPALPPLLLLGGLALRLAYDWLIGRWRVRAIPASTMALSLPVILLLSPHTAASKPSLGFVPAARAVWANVPDGNRVILIITGTGFEGAAVAELAMLDPHRPSLFALRGSRLLGGGGYNSAEYVPRFHNAAEVMAAIDEYRIPMVLFRSDGRSGEWAHVRQVADAMTVYPDRWQVIDRVPQDGIPVLLLRVRGNTDKSADLKRLTELAAPRALGAER